MHCDFCSEPVAVRVTEVRAGEPVDRKFCKQHAAEKLGVRGAEEWEAFLGGLVAHFKQHGTLPTAAEVSQQGGDWGAHGHVVA